MKSLMIVLSLFVFSQHSDAASASSIKVIDQLLDPLQPNCSTPCGDNETCQWGEASCESDTCPSNGVPVCVKNKACEDAKAPSTAAHTIVQSCNFSAELRANGCDAEKKVVSTRGEGAGKYVYCQFSSSNCKKIQAKDNSCSDDKTRTLSDGTKICIEKSVAMSKNYIEFTASCSGLRRKFDAKHCQVAAVALKFDKVKMQVQCEYKISGCEYTENPNNNNVKVMRLSIR